MFLTFTLSNCHSFVYEEHLVGNYYLVAVDSKFDMCVSYRLSSNSTFICKIEETVFEVGFNDRYIIAKQYAKGKKDKINYYILDCNNDGEFREKDEYLFGPMGKEEFQQKLNRISKEQRLEFTIKLNSIFQ